MTLSNRSYDASTNSTDVTFLGTVEESNDTVVIGYSSTSDVWPGGQLPTITNIDRTTPGATTVTINGNVPEGVPVVFGKNYEMRITLRPPLPEGRPEQRH